jgi:hypothetical protein
VNQKRKHYQALNPQIAHQQELDKKYSLLWEKQTDLSCWGQVQANHEGSIAC